VLITGASKGIGKAIAIAFAQAGVSGLALLARSDMSAVEAACTEAQRTGQHLRILTLRVDVTKPEDVDNAVKDVKERFGRLDILINNAGIPQTLSLIGDADPRDWWGVWEVQVLGTFQVTRAFLPLLLECAGDRTIVNMSSIAAHAVGGYNSAYGMSKLAILRFTELIMTEYAEKGILSYAVHPGFIATELTEKSVPEAYRHILVDSLDVASHTIVWLTRERREWLGGRYVSCQWDVEELEAKREEIVKGDKLKVKLVV